MCQAYTLCDWCTCHNYLDEKLWCRLLLMTLSVSSSSRAFLQADFGIPQDVGHNWTDAKEKCLSSISRLLGLVEGL